MPNLLAAYAQGQQAVANNKRNKLLDLQVQNAPAEQERSNRLADLQLQRQQQVVDSGARELKQADEAEGLKRGLAAADFILQSKSPKADLLRNFPEFVTQIGQGGIDVNSLDDQAILSMAGDVKQKLSARAGVGPAPKLQTSYGPDGQVIQTDPTTGKVTQAIAPREDFREKAEFTDQLARRRDAEQRKFTTDRDASNASLQRELAGQRALSKDEKATDGQRLSAGFLIRMQDTEPSFEGFVPTTKDYVLYNKILKNEGGFFGSGTAAELNKQLPAPAQEYFQQASDWVRAKLRKESGAVISPQEMLSEITTYFPLPGDSPKTVENKARSREVALEAMRIAAGAPGANASAPPRAGATQQPADSAPRNIASQAEYYQLQSGQQYIGPDGQLRQKR